MSGGMRVYLEDLEEYTQHRLNTNPCTNSIPSDLTRQNPPPKPTQQVSTPDRHISSVHVLLPRSRRKQRPTALPNTTVHSSGVTIIHGCQHWYSRLGRLGPERCCRQRKRNGGTRRWNFDLEEHMDRREGKRTVRRGLS